MKNLTCLLLLLFFAIIAHSQNINFTDPVFKAKLLSTAPEDFTALNLFGLPFKIDSNNDGEIDRGEAFMVRQLDVSQSGISSIEGIQHFANLKILYCLDNQLTSTLDLHNLLALESVFCSNNKLTNINVSGLQNLFTLNCNYNLLTSLDVSGLKRLYQLNCDHNQLATFNFDGAIYLGYLKCNNNNLTNLNFNILPGLEILDCSYNQLTTMELYGLGITRLDCSHNLLNTLTITNFTSLEQLYCSYNFIAKLDLTKINTDNFYRMFTRLECNNNNLTGTFDFAPVSRLNYFNCANNGFTAFQNIDKCQYLNQINCSYNNFSLLNLNGAVGLNILNCAYNPTQSIYMKNVNNTFSIYMYENPNLQYICASPNKISYMQQMVTQEGYTNCVIDSNCAFTLPIKNNIFEKSESISVYPNPVKSILNIVQNNILTESISIYNSIGQLVLTIPNAKQTSTIDVSSLKTGNYFLKVVSDIGISNTKFIKD